MQKRMSTERLTQLGRLVNDIDMGKFDKKVPVDLFEVALDAARELTRELVRERYRADMLEQNNADAYEYDVSFSGQLKHNAEVRAEGWEVYGHDIVTMPAGTAYAGRGFASILKWRRLRDDQ